MKEASPALEEVVDLSFPLRGNDLPRDHGYAVYATLCRVFPDLHGADWLGVHPITGPVAGDTLRLVDYSELRLRLPVERISDLLPLAGRSLNVAGALVTLGAPRIFALTPAGSLDSRLVVIRLTGIPHRRDERLGRLTLDNEAIARRYEQEIARQLQEARIVGHAQLTGRQHITVNHRRIIGYSVRVSGLSDADSIRLQQIGLGGKRRMGCGLFRATRRRWMPREEGRADAAAARPATT